MIIPDSDNDLINVREVEKTIGLAKTTIYRKISHGLFPRPLKFGYSIARWRRKDIEEWKLKNFI